MKDRNHFVLQSFLSGELVQFVISGLNWASRKLKLKRFYFQHIGVQVISTY